MKQYMNKCLRRLNKIGIGLSASRKLRIEDEAVYQSKLNILNNLKVKKVAKVTGKTWICF